MQARRIRALVYCSFLSWNVVSFFAGTVPCTAGWSRGASGRGRCGNPWIVLEINLFRHGNQDGGEYSKITGKRLWRVGKRKDHNMGGQLPGHEFNKIGTWESELQIIHNWLKFQIIFHTHKRSIFWGPKNGISSQFNLLTFGPGARTGIEIQFDHSKVWKSSINLLRTVRFEQLVGRHCSDLLVKKDFQKNTISF